jgi:hypothetical protein
MKSLSLTRARGFSDQDNHERGFIPRWTGEAKHDGRAIKVRAAAAARIPGRGRRTESTVIQ